MMSLAHSWIAIIGVPLHNQEKLPHRADDYISNSEIIVGAERHRARVAHHNRPYKQWQKPFADNDTLFSHHRTIAVLASGDPSFFGVAQFVRRHAQKHTVIVLPAVSSLSHAAARMGWAMEDVTCCSIHGRPLHSLLPRLENGGRYLILGDPAVPPAQCAEWLCSHGYGNSQLSLLQQLEEEEESISHWHVADWSAMPSCHERHIMALTCHCDNQSLPPRLGLNDDHFTQHTATKFVPRTLALVALRPFQGGTLWDVGAGSGSITIEWLRAHKRNRAIAIERQAQLCDAITLHADRWGVASRLTLIKGDAPACCPTDDSPHAIFIGGGISDGDLVGHCLARLHDDGILVAHAITLAAQHALMHHKQQRGGVLRHLQWSQVESLTPQHEAFHSNRPLLQWIWHKKS